MITAVDTNILLDVFGVHGKSLPQSSYSPSKPPLDVLATYGGAHAMNLLYELPIDAWERACSGELQERAVTALESGRVLYFPRLAFRPMQGEARFLEPGWSDGKSKNISLGMDRAVRGARGSQRDIEDLGQMMVRFAEAASRLVSSLLPSYVAQLARARTSFRPLEVEQRVSSYKKDDKRLHVDAFPSRPTRGERILRVFSNVHTRGRPRVWRLGEPFADMAPRYLPRIARPVAGSAWLFDRLGITKGRRSEYDHIMLRLHDMLKADQRYQAEAPQQQVPFPPGSTWIVFSDQVLHAAMSGQYLLEQTFHLPVAAMRDERTAPLRTLERLSGRRLVR
jgi:3-deoxy-D-manno-octulosonic acid hydroxylase-like protein